MCFGHCVDILEYLIMLIEMHRHTTNEHAKYIHLNFELKQLFTAQMTNTE